MGCGMLQWHAISTRPNAEGRVAIGLQGARLAAYLPVTLTRRTIRGRDHGIMWQPLFRNYIFARIDLGRDLTRVLAVDGVDSLVRGAGGKPAPIADDALEAIRAVEATGLFDHGTRLRLAEGDVVSLPGPWAGVIARVKSARQRRRLGLLIELTGLPFRVWAPAGRLEKVA
jgi:transcription antitermination factor NusG